jgi:Holliday junction resolvase RusA-like endonuclease
MKIVLDDVRAKSWNWMYAGTHWKNRSSYAKSVHQLVDAAVRDVDVNITPFECRVHITTIAYFKNRPTDPDNVCDKVFIDGLVGKVIHDDTRQYVASTTTISEIDKDNPRVEIVIEEETL